MKTRSDLIVRALDLLNVTEAGQNPAPEDIDAIDKIIDGKLEELDIREIISIPERDEFEDYLIDPLATILANTAAPAFGQPRNEESRLLAERLLLSFKPSTYVPGSPQEVDYF